MSDYNIEPDLKALPQNATQMEKQFLGNTRQITYGIFWQIFSTRTNQIQAYLNARRACTLKVNGKEPPNSIVLR